MRRIASFFNAAVALGLLALAWQGLNPAPAIGQANTVTTQSNLVNGHAVRGIAQRIIADAGGVAGGPPGTFLTELGVTNPGIGFCQNSGPTTSPYSKACWGYDVGMPR